jgi:hypothetical protein
MLFSDMYKSSLRHIHDPVLSSLKMKGIRTFTFLKRICNALEYFEVFHSVTLILLNTSELHQLNARCLFFTCFDAMCTFIRENYHDLYLKPDTVTQLSCMVSIVQCVRKVAVHLQKVLEVMSTSVYTGLNPFNFIRKHFLQICLRDVSYVRSYRSF